MAADLAVKLIYRKHFGQEHYDFLSENIDLTTSSNSWIKDLSGLIDDECSRAITYALNNKSKIIHVMLFLQKENDIQKYENFIDIWKKHDPAIAYQFEGDLRQKIRNQGL